MRQIQKLNADIWAKVQRSEIIEVEVGISRTGFGKLAQLGNEFGRLVELMEQFGTPTDAKAAGIGAQMAALASLDNSAIRSIVARAVIEPSYGFGAFLRTTHVRVDDESLDGDATLIGKVQRKLVKGDEYIALPGLTSVISASGDKAEGILSVFQGDQARLFGLVDPRVRDPGAVIVPLAIFR